MSLPAPAGGGSALADPKSISRRAAFLPALLRLQEESPSPLPRAVLWIVLALLAAARAALAHAGIAAAEVECSREKWEVRLGSPTSDHLVGQVLDAVRRALAGDPDAIALVILNGREYQMQGE